MSRSIKIDLASAFGASGAKAFAYAAISSMLLASGTHPADVAMFTLIRSTLGLLNYATLGLAPAFIRQLALAVSGGDESRPTMVRLYASAQYPALGIGLIAVPVWLIKRQPDLGTALLTYYIANPLEFRYLEQFYNSPFGVAHRRSKLLGSKEGCYFFRELFEEAVSQQVMKDLPLVLLFDLSFGPLFAAARDHILGFVALDDLLIARTIEACWDGVRR